MAKLIELNLSEAEQRELLWGQAYGSTPTYRNRCAMVLLKAQGSSNARVAGQLGVSEFTVNEWIRRYRCDQVAGLQSRPGRGAKTILNPSDLDTVRAVVGQHRQRLSVAKAQLEAELGKGFCQKTLERFVKKTGDDTSAFDAAPPVCRRKTITRSKSSN